MSRASAFVFVLLGPLCVASLATAATPQAAFRAIAVAEDQRRYGDGELIGYLKDGSAAVRARAARAVGRLQDSTSVRDLSALVADPDVLVRREAVFALGQVGHRSARAILERALADHDPLVVERAIEALGKVGDKASTAKIVQKLDAKSPGQRSEAAVALWKLADSTAVAALVAHLRDPVASVRWRVVYALEKVISPGAIVPAVTPLLQDRDPLIRAHAARTLGRQKSPLAVTALLGALQDTDAAVVVNALRALQGVADSTQLEQLPAITRTLRAHRDPYVRVTAATVLAEPFAWKGASAAGAQSARSTLQDGVADRDPATRGACGRAILMRDGLAALLKVQPLFADSVVYARTAVLDAFRNMPNPDYRSSPPRIANALTQSMAASRPLLERTTAAEVAGLLIGRLHLPAFDALLPRLRAGLDDPDVLVVAASAGALADAGDSLSVVALANAHRSRGMDAEPDARISIRDALRTLAGAAFADSVERANPAPARSAALSPDFADPPRESRAVITTSEGVMEWAFETAEAPQTVKNFVRLARKGYFNDLRVHRVVPDFVIQDGDPTGTGSGGPGYTIRCEYNPLRYETGKVGMALSGKDTGGSQWFVTLSPQPHLNGRYTIFARVTHGLEVARRITQGSRIVRVQVLP
ncbi:MAG: HEAT repeat domain-containing protein [Candidatus Eisenbacteria bacterium]